MKKIVIYGTGKIADVVQHFMREESDLPVVGFTVDGDYMDGDEFQGLPVVPFEKVVQEFDPADHRMFVAVGYHDLNRLRAQKLEEVRSKGFELMSYVHPNSSIPSDLKYGDNCFIMSDVLIHPRVQLGDNVFVWSGAMIGHHSTVDDHCWITSCANISGEVTVGKNCFFAVNATTGNGISIGDECFLGANTLVVKNLESKKVVIQEDSKPIRLDVDKFLKISQLR